MPLRRWHTPVGHRAPTRQSHGLSLGEGSVGPTILRRTKETLLELQRTVGNRAATTLLRSDAPEPDVAPEEHPDEQEADAVTRRVLQALHHGSSTPASEAGVRASIAGQVAQRRNVENPPAERGAPTEGLLSSGGSTPLPEHFRRRVEPLYGADLGSVRLHAGESSAELNGRLGSAALTRGRDVYFRGGLPDLADTAGQALLAHELAHTVQQGAVPTEGSGSAQRYSDRSASPSDRLPTEARAAASGAVLGQALPISRGAAGRIHRCACTKAPKVKEEPESSPPGEATSTVPEMLTGDVRDHNPQQIADRLSTDLPAFKTLRATADKKTQDLHGHALTYANRPKTGGGTAPAYFKSGGTYFEPNPVHVSQTILNVIFETANGAQADLFHQVEAADEKGEFDGDSFSYAKWVDHPDELGDLKDTAIDSFSRRSLVQEYYEWQSFLNAQASFKELLPSFSDTGNKIGVSSNLIWETSFGAIAGCKTFLEYYKIYGKGHRGAVEGALRNAAKKK